MTDNELISVLSAQLEKAVANFGWDFLVLQKNQPDQEGLPTKGTVFFEKVGDHRYGAPVVNAAYLLGADRFNEKTTQVMETTFQVSAAVIQDANDLTRPTPSDVANQVCIYIQSRTSINDFWASKVSIVKVTDVRNPYIVDDRDRFESMANFDIITIHHREVDINIPAIMSIQGDEFVVLEESP